MVLGFACSLLWYILQKPFGIDPMIIGIAVSLLITWQVSASSASFYPRDTSIIPCLYL